MGRGALATRVLGGAAGLLLAMGLYLGLVVAPPDAVQGDVQRIMYVHVPSIVTAYIAFFVVFCTSILYLWKRDLRFDALAVSSAECGHTEPRPGSVAVPREPVASCRTSCSESSARTHANPRRCE